MNLLFIGDIFGSLGRDTLQKHLRKIRDDYKINYIIANGENAAHGKGITEKIYKELLEMGIHVITLGNHSFDNRDIFNFIDDAKNLLRPLNSDRSVPGKGYDIYNYNGIKIAVINLMGRVFLTPMECPFRAFDDLYEEIKDRADIIFVDFHAEATSEKIAFAYYVDGRATAVVGTHTHVPTADNRLLDKGTAYITDVGMTGPLDGIIGIEREAVISRFINNLPSRFLPVEEGNSQLNAVVIQIDQKTYKATKIERINLIDKRVLL